MEIYSESLAYALAIAIAVQEKDEKRRGYTVDSAMLATWRAALQAVKEKKDLIILDK